MFVATVVSSVLGANCHVVGPSSGGPVAVIDPGFGVLDGIVDLVARHDLSVVAVLATHGHPDHIFDFKTVSDYFGVPAYISAADSYRLKNPMSGLDSDLARVVGYLTGEISWKMPEKVIEIDAKAGQRVSLELPGVSLTAIGAPGHTEGSTLYLGDGIPDSDFIVRNSQVELTGMHTVFTGDVLFAGSVGRTDLPGGDSQVMATTLHLLASMIEPATVLLPGHGPYSTMDHELALNPYL